MATTTVTAERTADVRRDHRLTSAMCTALVDALRHRRDEVSRLTCHPATTRGLIARGLAVHDPGTEPILTGAGELAAARLFDDGTARLEAGDVVIYHGSIEWERGCEFVVAAHEEGGRYTIVDTYNGSCTLRQVRRTSMSWTGHTLIGTPANARYCPQIGVADLPHAGDVQVATGLPQVNAYRRALWRIRALAPQVKLAHSEYTSYAKAAAGSRRASVREIVERRRRRYDKLAAELRELEEGLADLRVSAEQAAPAAAARARLSIAACLEATEAERNYYSRRQAAQS